MGVRRKRGAGEEGSTEAVQYPQSAIRMTDFLSAAHIYTPTERERGHTQREREREPKTTYKSQTHSGSTVRGQQSCARSWRLVGWSQLFIISSGTEYSMRQWLAIR